MAAVILPTSMFPTSAGVYFLLIPDFTVVGELKLPSLTGKLAAFIEMPAPFGMESEDSGVFSATSVAVLSVSVKSVDP